MVKGITRRVIVIKSPDPELFDEAVFFVREDAFTKGVSRTDVLRQAQKTANDYLRSARSVRAKRTLPPYLYAVFGGAAASLLWGIFLLVF